MNIIEQLLALIGMKKQKNNLNSESYISQRQMEMMAEPTTTTESITPNKGGPVPEGANAVPVIPTKGGPMEAIDAAVSSPLDMQVQTSNQLAGSAGKQQMGGYQDVSPSELKPVDGFPGQFTNGGGKGGQDPTTGNSIGTYPVFDANGKFLGENASLVINGVTTNYGYSYGTSIPRDIDLSQQIMNQEEALQSAGLNIDSVPSDAAVGPTASPTMSEEAQVQISGIGLPDPNDNKDTRNAPSDSTWVQHSKEDAWAMSESTGQEGKGGPVNGVDTSIPAGMVGTPDGLIMNQETALRSAGLDMSGLTGTPNKGGPSEASVPAPSPTSDHDPAQQYNVENIHIPSNQEVQAAVAATAQDSAAAAADAVVASPYDQEVATANVLERNLPTAHSSQQRLEAGRARRLDPDGEFGGGANFDAAGPAENPGVDVGGDPTAGGGGSYNNFAV